MHTVTVANKTISVFSATTQGAPIVYLNTHSDEGQQVFEVAQAAGYLPFTLVAISGLGWNHDMAPWDSPVAFKKGESFTRGANDYLRLLAEEIMPEVEKGLPGPRHGVGSPDTPGWPVCPVRHLPDGCVLPVGVYVWFSVVSWL